MADHLSKSAHPLLAAFGCDAVDLGVKSIRIQTAYSTEHDMVVDTPPIMNFLLALGEAPATYAAVSGCRSPAQLFRLLEDDLKVILGEREFFSRWRHGLWAVYRDFQPRMLELFARNLVAIGLSHPKAQAALSIYAYALCGMALGYWVRNGTLIWEYTGRRECADCFQTALEPSLYCHEHRTSREDRQLRTRKAGAAQNLEVLRRRAARIKNAARQFLRDERTIYSRLYKQLVNGNPDISVYPRALTPTTDGWFVAGTRIGTDGAIWLIYLWCHLPRVRRVLGDDWPEIVSCSYRSKDWSEVIRRLRIIDPYNESTDAAVWAKALIHAEAWQEAAETDRLERGPGRPRRDANDPGVNLALSALRGGAPVAAVARWKRKSSATIYRWGQNAKKLQN